MSVEAFAARHVDIESFIREGMPVLEYTLRLMSQRIGSLATMDEMRASAHRGLLEAAKTYDPARASLATYAARKIRWAILDSIKHERRSRRVTARVAGLLASEALAEGVGQTSVDVGATAEEHEAHLDRLLEAHAAAIALGLLTGDRECPSETESPEAQLSRKQLSTKMHAALVELPERERAIIERHYFEGEAFEQIAEQLRISKSWTSRLHASAIERLATAMRARVDDF